jgi:M6 family metalloprotease-like protein
MLFFPHSRWSGVVRVEHGVHVFRWPVLLVLWWVLGGASAAAAAPAGGRSAPGQLQTMRLEALRGEAARLRVSGDTTGAQQRQRQIEQQRRWQTVERMLGPRLVSRKSHQLLRRRGLGPALLVPGGSPAGKVAPDQPDTLRILLVRISFAADRSGPLTSVTEDGDFLLRERTDEDFIDPPPHDRAYFEAHLAGLAEYYRLESGGRLQIESRVLPDEPRGSYQLSDLADYGPGAGNFWTLEGLERLVRDMIAVADSGAMHADPPARLADYDDDDPFTYVIFVHAGSDWQSDVNADSPNDVPTFFVSLAKPVLLGSFDRENLQPGALSECSVIPETTSQDGWLGSIAAGLYHEFGHALGLVDIYSTATGLPQVGVWSLMDSGTNVFATIGRPYPGIPDSIQVVDVIGALPPSLGAWDKWFLGWLEVAEIGGTTRELRLPPVEIPRTTEEYGRYRDFGYDVRLDDPQAYCGGVSRREFFLVENRWVPLDGSQVPDESGVGVVTDRPTGVIQYLGGDWDPVAGRYRNTALYDYYLPASGLLVWHVNMERIAANLETNTINWYGDGLRLVEADGIQDIGVLEPYVIGIGGSATDPFNEVNGDALRVEGAPSSRAFDRSWTGLYLEGIRGLDAADAVMTCTAGQAGVRGGTPLELPALTEAEAASDSGAAGPRALMPRSATPVTIQAGSVNEPVILVADEPRQGWGRPTYHAQLFAFRPDGTPLVPAQDGRPAGAVFALGAPLAGPPVLVPQADGGGDLLVVGLRDGRVVALGLELADGQLPVRWGPVRVGGNLAWTPVPGRAQALLCVVAPDTLRLIDTSGGLGEALVLSGGEPAGVAARPCHLDEVGTTDADAWAVPGTAGWHLLVASGMEATLAGSYPYAALASWSAPLWATDVPASEASTLVLMDGAGATEAWRIAGGEVEGPLDWPVPPEGGPVGEPAVADLDGDGRHDLIVATATRLYAWQDTGVLLRGWPVRLGELFPLPDTTAFAGPLAICDGGGDAVNEVFMTTNGGHLLSLDGEGRLRERTPFLWGTGRQSALAVAGEGADRFLWLLEAGGLTGPPRESRWYSGRLLGYELQAAVGLAGTSEWLGPGGGVRRRGPSGVATALSGATPAQAEVAQTIVYPNPWPGPRAGGGGVTGSEDLQVRFFSASDRPALLTIYNIEGEMVLEATLPALADRLNDVGVEMPDLASGLYVCRLRYESAAGLQTRLLTLAVER